MLASHIPGTKSSDRNKAVSSVEGPKARLENQNSSISTPALLKKQSEFLLPHQNNDTLAALAGTDDCPGRIIPEGTYTEANPFIETGNTTGANDTITRMRWFASCYYAYEVPGPDHIYSFMLTGRGPNAQIKVSRTSGLYQPDVYILNSSCKGGIKNDVCGVVQMTFSGSNGIATFPTFAINTLPLNVPLLLVIDSTRFNFQAGSSGPYQIQIQDVSIGQPMPCPSTNLIDCTGFFVPQQYSDFLGRPADDAGLAFWSNEIVECGTDESCIEAKRINVSAAFYLSIEFQETGFLVYRMYKASFGNLPGSPVPIRFQEFLSDTQEIGRNVVVKQDGWEQVLENNKQFFAIKFVRQTRFITAFPLTLTPTQFVDRLFANAEITSGPTKRDDAINEFGAALTTIDDEARARVVLRVAESASLARKEFNRAFVLMQYFGYLRRNPNNAPEPTLDFQGYNFWLNKLNQFNGNFIEAEMVKAFLSSDEYRRRFAP